MVHSDGDIYPFQNTVAFALYWKCFGFHLSTFEMLKDTCAYWPACHGLNLEFSAGISLHFTHWLDQMYLIAVK